MSTESNDIARHRRNETPSTSMDPTNDERSGSRQGEGMEHSNVEALNASLSGLLVANRDPIPTRLEIPLWLKSCFPECYFNWIQPLSKFGVEDAQLLNQRMQNRYSNVDEDVVLKELEHVPFDVLSSKLANAFCHLFLREFESAAILLKDVTDKVSYAVHNAFITPDHGKGITYLVKGLEAYQNFLEVKTESHDVEQSGFALLPHQAAIVVRGFKARFVSASFREDVDEQISIFQQICDEDPENSVEWMLAMNEIYKQARKSDCRFGRKPPSSKEKAILTECIQKEPNNTVVKLSIAQFLGEILCGRKCNLRIHPLTFTDTMKFKTEDEVREYVNAVSRDVLKTFEGSRKFLLSLSELLTMTLPRCLRDLKTGKKCLQMVLNINPDGSKDNHRMGIFLFVHENNFEEGLVYTRKAYDVQPTNFPALMDTLQLMMGEVDKNATEIRTLFNFELKETGGKWNDERKGLLYNLYGIFCFMFGNREDVIPALVVAHKFNKKALWNLKKIPNQGERYNWKCDKLSLRKFREFLISSLGVPPFSAWRQECLELAILALTQGIEIEDAKKYRNY